MVDRLGKNGPRPLFLLPPPIIAAGTKHDPDGTTRGLEKAMVPSVQIRRKQRLQV
jgi:hypothetical protein